MPANPAAIAKRLATVEARKSPVKYWITGDDSIAPPKGAWLHIKTGLPEWEGATVPGGRIHQLTDGTRRYEEVDPGGRHVRFVDASEVLPPPLEHVAPADPWKGTPFESEDRPAPVPEPTPEPAPPPPRQMSGIDEALRSLRENPPPPGPHDPYGPGLYVGIAGSRR